MVDGNVSGAVNAPVANVSDLAAAGAVGVTTSSVIGGDISTLTKDAASVAVNAVTGHTAETQAAISALAGGIVALGEHAAAAANPAAGLVANVVGPEIIPVLTAAITSLMTKIGLDIPAELAALEKWALSASAPAKAATA